MNPKPQNIEPKNIEGRYRGALSFKEKFDRMPYFVIRHSIFTIGGWDEPGIF